MTDRQDLAQLTRSIIDSNRYMTLGTADESGLDPRDQRLPVNMD